MVKFKYIAVKNGRKYEGEVEAENRFEVYDVVRKEGGKIISIMDTKWEKFSIFYWNARFSTVKESEKIAFADNLAAMMRAGLSITRALSVSERQTPGPRMKLVISSISSDIQKGKSFYDAVSKFPGVFSRTFISMIRAGEEGGDLPGALSTVARQMKKTYLLKKKIKGAMIYPSIIVIAIIGIGIVMMIQVVPSLASTFAELKVELPKSTQMIIAISNFMKENYVMTLLIFVAFVLSFILIPKTKYGKRALDWVALHLPIIKDLSKEINSARMARTFSSLVSAGVDLVTALEITGDTLSNHYHTQVLQDAATHVKKGRPLSEIFEKNEKFFTPLVTEVVAVGEETGSLSTLMENMADFYEEIVEQKTKDMSTIIEPFLMLIVGIAVGFFAIAMIKPIYSITTAI